MAESKQWQRRILNPKIRLGLLEETVDIFGELISKGVRKPIRFYRLGMPRLLISQFLLG